MKDYAHTVKEELAGIVAFVGAIWAAFLVGRLLHLHLEAFGLVPRRIPGLIGIAAMPFLHANFAHLLGNTLPLLILLALLAGSRARSWETVAETALAGGALLWLFGRSAVHVGASGLVFGLASFLIVAGLLEKRIIPLIVSLLVGFLYGGTLVWGVLPIAGYGVSWDGHLAGAIAGVAIAFAQIRESGPQAGNPSR